MAPRFPARGYFRETASLDAAVTTLREGAGDEHSELDAAAKKRWPDGTAFSGHDAMHRKITIIAAGLAGVLAAAAPALAADPIGTWVTGNGKARVRIARCGTALCGTLVWLAEPNDPATGKPRTDRFNPDPSKRDRPAIGTTIVRGLKPAARAGRWTGTLYNAEDGKLYSGSLTMQGPNAMRLEGCALVVFCKSQTWTRVN
jgi:uncharacterized protein (DUF2147 family)